MGRIKANQSQESRYSKKKENALNKGRGKKKLLRYLRNLGSHFLTCRGFGSLTHASKCAERSFETEHKPPVLNVSDFHHIKAPISSIRLTYMLYWANSGFPYSFIIVDKTCNSGSMDLLRKGLLVDLDRLLGLQEGKQHPFLDEVLHDLGETRNNRCRNALGGRAQHRWIWMESRGNKKSGVCMSGTESVNAHKLQHTVEDFSPCCDSSRFATYCILSVPTAHAIERVSFFCLRSTYADSTDITYIDLTRLSFLLT
ncbi:unnamed protein product [Ilex paraguariensis]|uniref:Uncharacterized protein n=1 Tax=Ilex paraguariensis TaxID=185542 RepID=A0ABC8TFZ2_9AQUA